MTSSLNKKEKDFLSSFSQNFSKAVTKLLWEHWSEFGVGGGSYKSSSKTVLDIEAMLLSTWQIGRVDARLFDEVLRWCCYWGDEVDILRLKTYLQKAEDRELEFIAGAFSESVAVHGKKKRWLSLSKGRKKDEVVPLFMDLEGKALGSFGEGDPIFRSFGLLRGEFHLRGKPTTNPFAHSISQARSSLRSIFGQGVRSEVILSLLVRKKVTPKVVAQLSGYSTRGVQQVLTEMAKTSFVVEKEIPGEKRRYPLKSYSIEQKRWFYFLFGEGEVEFPWFHWMNFFQGMALMWSRLCTLQRVSLSPYKLKSLLKEGTEKAHFFLSQVDLDGTRTEPILQMNQPNFLQYVEEYWSDIFESVG